MYLNEYTRIYVYVYIYVYVFIFLLYQGKKQCKRYGTKHVFAVREKIFDDWRSGFSFMSKTRCRHRWTNGLVQSKMFVQVFGSEGREPGSDNHRGGFSHFKGVVSSVTCVLVTVNQSHSSHPVPWPVSLTLSLTPSLTLSLLCLLLVAEHQVCLPVIFFLFWILMPVCHCGSSDFCLVSSSFSVCCEIIVFPSVSVPVWPVFSVGLGISLIQGTELWLPYHERLLYSTVGFFFLFLFSWGEVTRWTALQSVTGLAFPSQRPSLDCTRCQ